MAKGVNLTSKEWRDLVFEGKNKEFGAYQFRKKSARRHNMAMAFFIILLIAVAILVIGWTAYSKWQDEQEALAKGAQMSEVMFEQEQAAEEEEEEVKYEEEKPEEQVEEEQVASQQVTAIAIVDKPDKDKEVKNMDEIQENQAQVGNVNQEGKIDVAEINTATKAVTVVEEPKPEPKVEKPAPDKIFEAVEQQAEFPGGQGALMKWLSNNIRYPELAQQNNVSGRVFVKFCVEKDGSISNATVVRGVDKDLDKEAIRVVKKMPKWHPGKNNNVAVRSYFTLPVTFKLLNM